MHSSCGINANNAGIFRCYHNDFPNIQVFFGGGGFGGSDGDINTISYITK
jgi:hypothetical protein